MSTFTAGQILLASQMNTQAGDSGWIRVAGGVGFQNSWNEFGTLQVSYRLIGQVVVLKGMLYGGTAATAFVLPSGYRPTQLMTFAVIDSTPTTPVPKRLQIDSTGTVTPQTNTDFHYLDGISFAIN